ncbi:MAG: PrsW family glutamic-type intramembrane protease [Halobacteriales archaeon]|nr:PrsW family glutamic-type intramembrane protease [Halobacteriales archaeon]
MEARETSGQNRQGTRAGNYRRHGFRHGAGFVTLGVALAFLVGLASFLLSESNLYTLLVSRPEVLPSVGFAAVASLLPASLVAVYVWFSDTDDRLSVPTLVAGFGLGALVTVFAGEMNVVAFGWFETVPAFGAVFFFYLFVGPFEEGMKMLAVYLHPSGVRFDRAVQYAVLGAFVGLGFAFVENLLYITSNAVFGWETLADAAVGRSGISPLHVVLSAVAGYYIGRARRGDGYGVVTAVNGLVTVAFLHATYNTLVSSLETSSTGGAQALGGNTAVVVVGFFVVILYLLESMLRGSRLENSREAEDTGLGSHANAD